MTLPAPQEQALQRARWREFPAYIITFDPAGTALAATNVQAALTEIAAGGGGGGGTQAIIRDCSDETTSLTTGLKHTFRAPYDMVLEEIRGSLTTAATGSTLFAFDVQVNGVSVFSTKPTFDDGEKTTVTATDPPALATAARGVAVDAEITIIVDAVGSTISGAGLKVYLAGTPGTYTASLPPPSGLVAWYQRGTGITGGGSVTRWADQSGNGHHMGTYGGAPALQGDGSILFDGTNDSLRTESFTLNQPITVYAVVSMVSWSNNAVAWAGRTTDATRLHCYDSPPTMVAYSGNIASPPVDLAIGSYNIVTVVYNGGSSLVQVDNGTEETGTFGTVNPTGFVLGARGNDTVHGNFQFKEFLIYSGAHDSTQRAAVKAYLATV